MTSPHTDASEIHVPEPSVWPFTLTVGVVFIAAGVLASIAISGIGLGIVFIALAGWTQENRTQAAHEE
jgi:hypothetical protein